MILGLKQAIIATAVIAGSSYVSARNNTLYDVEFLPIPEEMTAYGRNNTQTSLYQSYLIAFNDYYG